VITEILSRAAADGLIITPEGSDSLRVRGPAAARERWRDVLLQHKHAIRRHLWTEDLLEYFNERAAILEFDAGLSRAEAEEQARRATALLARNRGAPWCALRAALGDQSLPDTNEPVDRLPYPLPTWCVLPNGKPIRQGVFSVEALRASKSA
jgi:hypothetical protein